MKAFVREKKIYCGKKYLEVDCFTYTDRQKVKRGKREKVSAPKQTNLNDKNAKRYLTQLSNGNFGAKDLHVTQTYDKNHLPETIEDADKISTNFLRRVGYRRKKLGLSPLKYIIVTEYSLGKDGTKPTRIHHHIIMNGGLDRDEVEDLWRTRKQKGQKQGDVIGFINADRLKPTENGVAALCNYLMKNPNGKKRWSCSQNLTKPYTKSDDERFSQRQIEKWAKTPPTRDFWEKKYKGYTLVNDDYGFQAIYNDNTGWALYLKLRRKE